MKEILINKGWEQRGGCSPCGVENFVNSTYPEYVVKVKKKSRGFTIVRNNKEVVTLTAAVWLDEKLGEL